MKSPQNGPSSLKGKQHGYFFKSVNVLYLPTEPLKFNRLILMLKGFETPITRAVFKTDFSPPQSEGNPPMRETGNEPHGFDFSDVD